VVEQGTHKPRAGGSNPSAAILVLQPRWFLLNTKVGVTIKSPDGPEVTVVDPVADNGFMLFEPGVTMGLDE
jgi:hypothetical protein